MKTKCERCGKREASVVIWETVEGVVLERNLCEECARVKRLPPAIPMQWRCHCGKELHWDAPLPDCEHQPEDYESIGEQKLNVARCECGVVYTARANAWRCRVCGKTALFPPQMGGARGFLRDYLYGSTHMAKVELEGRKPS